MDNRLFFIHGILFVYGLFTMVSLIIAKANCMPDLYYDSVTRSCAPCTDICVNAKIQRTVSECRHMCPDFVAAISISKTDAVPDTTTLSHNTTSPQSQDGNIHNTDLTTILMLSFVTISVIIYVIIRSVCLFMDRSRPHTQQHAQNEQGTSRWETCLYGRKKQSDGSMSEAVSLASLETNVEASQQPHEDDVTAKLLVTGAESSKPLEQGGIEAQTQRKEVDTTHDQY